MERKRLKNGPLLIQYMELAAMLKTCREALAMWPLIELICLFFWIYLVVKYPSFQIISPQHQIRIKFYQELVCFLNLEILSYFKSGVINNLSNFRKHAYQKEIAQS